MKQRKTTRLLAILFALLMVLPFVLVSCKDDTKPTDNSTSKGGSTADDSRVPSGIPDTFDYGGKTFTICVASGGWGSDGDDMWREENSSSAGDPIYDAIIERNNKLSEGYGIDLGKPYGLGVQDGAYALIKNSLDSNDGAFQAISTRASDCVNLALTGYLADVNEISSINPQNDWWDDKMVNECTLNDKLYFLVGDYRNNEKEATYAIAFNKSMYARNMNDAAFGADGKSLYDIVNAGDWTFDKMVTMASFVGNDIDGNQKYDENDVYGLSYPQCSYVGFLGAAGIKLGRINNEADPPMEVAFNNDKTYGFWRDMIDMTKGNWSFNWHLTYVAKRFDMFYNNQVLFMADYMEQIEYLRAGDSNFEFGIVPFPKYDTAQAEYISPVHEYGTNFLCIPIANGDLENTGYVLEALNYESMYTLKPAFYDKVLLGNLTRDEESEPMLDLIYKTRAYDFGLISNWGGFNDRLLLMFNNQNPNMASTFTSFQARIQTSIEKAFDQYEVD